MAMHLSREHPHLDAATLRQGPGDLMAQGIH
jgi:hypothetical protein